MRARKVGTSSTRNHMLQSHAIHPVSIWGSTRETIRTHTFFILTGAVHADELHGIGQPCPSRTPAPRWPFLQLVPRRRLTHQRGRANARDRLIHTPEPLQLHIAHRTSIATSRPQHWSAAWNGTYTAAELHGVRACLGEPLASAGSGVSARRCMPRHACSLLINPDAAGGRDRGHRRLDRHGRAGRPDLGRRNASWARIPVPWRCARGRDRPRPLLETVAARAESI